MAVNNPITPHVLNILLRRVKNVIQVQDYARAVKELDIVLARPFGDEFFDEKTVDLIHEHLDLAASLLLLDAETDALASLKALRAEVLDPIFVKNLWMANRIMHPDGPRDIGVLDTLPELVQFEIRKALYDFI